MNRKQRFIASLVFVGFGFVTTLVACGGSGSSAPSDPFGDGLGISGQAPGLIRIAAGLSVGPASLVLDDTGRALIVWYCGTLCWNRSNATRNWESASALSQTDPVTSKSPVLRATPDGDNAVVGYQGSTGPKLLRYAAATAWEASPIDLPGTIYGINLDDNWSDLSILPDSGNSVALTVIGPASVQPLGNEESVRVLRHNSSSNWSTLVETAPFYQVRASHLATNRNGLASLFWHEADSSGSNALHLQTIDITSGSAFAPWSLPRGSYGFPCVQFPRARQLTSATSLTKQVIGLTHGPSASNCNFSLIQVDDGSTAAQLMNVGSVYSQPLIVMSQAGDALAIWDEEPTSGGRRVMWSQSLQGGPWSTPAPLVISSSVTGLDPIPYMWEFSIAINASGQVAVGLGAVKDHIGYIVVGRFGFSSGWTNWQVIAQPFGTPVPSVAINAEGQALAVYGAMACDRRAPGSYTNCRGGEMYAYYF